MAQQLFKNHWIVFRKVWTRILVYTNIFEGKNKKAVNRKKQFKQILNVNRPFLIIEEDEDNFLVLTLTKHSEDKEQNENDWEDKDSEQEENPFFKRFWIKCDYCLTLDSYVRLETKILMSRDFVEFYFLKLKDDDRIKHQCLSEPQFLELRKALDIYWSKENKQLTLVKLGIGGGKVKETDKWILLNQGKNGW